MIIVEVKDGESIDRAIKRYKQKHRRIGVIRELRGRKEYTKPSVRRRATRMKAAYRAQKMREMGI